jgi:hypothetical protein
VRGWSWLAERRRALSLTVEGLGAAVGIAASTIIAVESGDHDLTPRQRGRVEAYFESQREQLPADLLHAEIWVRAETLSAAQREAKKRGITMSHVLGEWAERGCPERR